MKLRTLWGCYKDNGRKFPFVVLWNLEKYTSHPESQKKYKIITVYDKVEAGPYKEVCWIVNKTISRENVSNILSNNGGDAWGTNIHYAYAKEKGYVLLSGKNSEVAMLLYEND